VPRIALTATADAPTRREIVERLLVDAREFVAVSIGPTSAIGWWRKTIAQTTGRFHPQRTRRRCRHRYCLGGNTVDEVAVHLNAHNVPALPYHAGLDGGARASNQARFLREDGIVMVATIAFGMGIDKPDVRFVAHLDMPRASKFISRRRAAQGRDGAPAQAWMTYGWPTLVQQRRLIEFSEADTNYKRLSSSKLDAMLGLAESGTCRRVRLLAYFGETSAACGNCDNCSNRRSYGMAPKRAQAALVHLSLRARERVRFRRDPHSST